MRLAAIGAVGGLLSGAFGVGGGILMVPLLITFAGMDQRRAMTGDLAREGAARYAQLAINGNRVR